MVGLQVKKHGSPNRHVTVSFPFTKNSSLDLSMRKTPVFFMIDFGIFWLISLWLTLTLFRSSFAIDFCNHCVMELNDPQETPEF